MEQVDMQMLAAPGSAENKSELIQKVREVVGPDIEEDTISFGLHVSSLSHNSPL